MKELSLNILDISMNSVKAKADTIHIAIIEDEHKLSIEIADNGCGMKEDSLKNVTNPFLTTRTTSQSRFGAAIFQACGGTDRRIYEY